MSGKEEKISMWELLNEDDGEAEAPKEFIPKGERQPETKISME